jgi:hypothetical protein
MHKTAGICSLGVLGLLTAVCPAQPPAQQAASEAAKVPYQRNDLPIEERLKDLLGRMTLEEKVRQLDLYSAATMLVDKHLDETHAAHDAVFLPANAQGLFGSLGAGGIHDIYPTPEQSNAIQKWVIDHNRLGIPALFVEEGLHGFNKGTVFPAPIELAATWNPEIVEKKELFLIIGEVKAASIKSLSGNSHPLTEPENHLESVEAAGKPMVLVLENGRALTIGWAKAHVPAILEAWYPGEFG